MNKKETWFTQNYPTNKNDVIAYFSAEYGLDEILPIYSGGLGILSGDHLKSASDLVLKVNDLYSVILLLVVKAFEVSPDDKKSFVIDSIKPMTNQYLEKLMKTITDEELKTIDK